MSQIQTPETDHTPQATQPWTAPTLTRLEMEDAEAGAAGTTDSGILS
ncbi:MAG: hypothetical protein V7672_03900 [Brevundimonas sp.]|jgi:hypothetical protein